MQQGDVQATRRDERRPSRRGILFGLLPLALVAAALVPSPAQADPQTADGCTVQLQGEPPGPLGPSNTAELTIDCEFDVKTVEISGNNDKQFLVVLLAQGEGGGFACLPLEEPGTSATCTGTGTPAATFTILAMDVCGAEDNTPLDFMVTLTGPPPEQGDPPQAVFEALPIQCEEPAQPSTTPPPATTAQAAPPGGTGGGTDGGTDGGGTGGVTGAEDSGQVPLGGVQSGAGGTAPADDDGAGLLAAVVGLMLAATLGLGIARVRSARE